MPALTRQRSTQVPTLPPLPVLRLRCTLEAAERARLPSWQGSMLRGAWGHALRRAVCAMSPEQACAECRLRRECAYTRLFECFVEGEPPPFLRGLSTAPRPYVFEPEAEPTGGGAPDRPRSYAPGDPLRFDLLLVGAAADLRDTAVLAVERMAETGLGTRRARFRLAHAETLPPASPPTAGSIPAETPRRAPGHPAEHSPASASIPAEHPSDGAIIPVEHRSDDASIPVEHPSAAPGRPAERPPTVPPVERPLPAGGAVLRFLTPTRLKIGGRLTDRFTFRQLVFPVAAVPDPARVPSIDQAIRHPGRQSQLLVELAQQQRPAVRRDLRRIELDHDRLRGVKRQAELCATLWHLGRPFLGAGKCLNTLTLPEKDAPDSTLLVNFPG